MAYRVYITDTLWAYGREKYLDQRFTDIINPKPKDTRAAEEIAADVIRRVTS